jgi:elongation factor P hydroxylase
MTDHQFCKLIIESFNEEFKELNTVVKGGFDEPFYLAQNEDGYSEIQFRENFPRSALHEISHWCVAGVERRKQDDFGYWYAPDGRTQEEQDAFFKIEVLPQAYERYFCLALNMKFEPSADNLNGTVEGLEQFNSDLKDKFNELLKTGFPNRVERLYRRLKGSTELISFA